jgi:hypothetical protein
MRQLERDRDGVDIKLSDLLSPHNCECRSLASTKRTTALKDAEGPRETLGNALDKCKIALGGWLECVKTLAAVGKLVCLNQP